MYQYVFDTANNNERVFLEALEAFMDQHDVHIHDYEEYDDDEEVQGSTLHFWSKSATRSIVDTIQVELSDVRDKRTEGAAPPEVAFIKAICSFLEERGVEISEGFHFVSTDNKEPGIDIDIADLAD